MVHIKRDLSYDRLEWHRFLMNEIFVRDEYRLHYAKDIFPEIDVILDIGANMGYFTMYAKELYPAAKIVAVEPFMSALGHFRKNTEGLTDVSVVHGAFSDGSDLYGLPNDFCNMWSQCSGEGSTDVRIRGYNFAELFKRFDLDQMSTYMIKIDCEGSERYLSSDSNWDYVVGCAFISGELHYDEPGLEKKEYYREMMFRLQKSHYIVELSYDTLNSKRGKFTAARKMGDR